MTKRGKLICITDNELCEKIFCLSDFHSFSILAINLFGDNDEDLFENI